MRFSHRITEVKPGEHDIRVCTRINGKYFERRTKFYGSFHDARLRQQQLIFEMADLADTLESKILPFRRINNSHNKPLFIA